MATTQPWTSGGALLAGIGNNNPNAPQANDINTTLALIERSNEIQRSGANNLGLQALQGLTGVAQAYKQNQQAERQKAFQQEYGNAFKSGDRSAMRDLAAKYPDQFENVQKGMGFIDDDHRTTMGNLAMNAQLAAGQGPEAFDSFLKSNATELNRVGVNPADVGQTYQQNPQGASDLFGNLAMFSLGPKGYLDVLDKREGRVIDRDKVAVDRERLAETARSNRVGEAQGWANVGIAQQNVNVRKLELQDKALDRQIARETNQVQLGVLQDKRDATKRELEQAKTDKADAYNTSMDTMSRTIDTANQVLNSPGFTGYFGTNINPFSSRFIPGTDAADTSALIDTLRSQGFMSGIQQMKGLGALSNAEGQKIMDAIGNLSSSQSENSAKNSINTIISTTKLAQKRLQQKYGKDIPMQQPSQQQPTQPQQQAGFSTLWGE
ncbi:phage DNA ejection protein [Pectobacterium brasiliense]|uniref:phage DNA ejection protein n=1 Tax=Pectobacterium brasiliense TaxID=180957 RepID=UPI0005803F9F|nr:phage DNA ejection protein [Pectobacterium brasiliense]KHT21020.1 DNA injection protein [Pectobacterium brasiliense]